MVKKLSRLFTGFIWSTAKGLYSLHRKKVKEQDILNRKADLAAKQIAHQKELDAEREEDIRENITEFQDISRESNPQLIVRMKIKIYDTIDCGCNPALARIIKPLLSYTVKRDRKEYQKTIMRESKDKSEWFFSAGLLPKIKNFCQEKNIPVEIEGQEEKLPFIIPTEILTTSPNKREEQEKLQLRLVQKAVELQRGVLVAPTGTGKTSVGLTIISAFLKDDKIKVLWLCHTKVLMYQAGKQAEILLKKTVGYVGDTNADLDKQLTFATRQSFKKYCVEYGHLFDIVIIDEIHHLSSIQVRKKVNGSYIEDDTEYAFILTKLLAPVRIGLTATLPLNNKEAMLAIEGLLGPLMDEITFDEGVEKNIMAKPKLRFLKLPEDQRISALRAYQDVYNYGVVERDAQHKLIAEETKKYVEQKKSVLILVNQLQHGRNIERACGDIGINCTFAHGSTRSERRDRILDLLIRKKMKCVIASTIWKEGVNIPSLDVVFLAAGGKSDIAVLQSIGRGLRKTDEKDEVIIVDILDTSHRYFVEHIAERHKLFSNLGWLND